MMTIPTFLSQAVVNTRQEMNRTFGQRLGEMVTSTSLQEHQEKSQQHIPVEEIVAKEKLAYVEPGKKLKNLFLIQPCLKNIKRHRLGRNSGIY